MSRPIFHCPSTNIVSPDILEPLVKLVGQHQDNHVNSLIQPSSNGHSCLLLSNCSNSKSSWSRRSSKLCRGIFDRKEIKEPIRECREEPFDEETTPLPSNFRCKQVPLNATRDPGLLDSSFTRIHSDRIGHQVALTHRFFILRLDNPRVYKTFSTGSSMDGNERLLDNDRFLERDSGSSGSKIDNRRPQKSRDRSPNEISSRRPDNGLNHKRSDYDRPGHREPMARRSDLRKPMARPGSGLDRMREDRKRSPPKDRSDRRSKRRRASDSSSRDSSTSRDKGRDRNLRSRHEAIWSARSPDRRDNINISSSKFLDRMGNEPKKSRGNNSAEGKWIHDKFDG